MSIAAANGALAVSVDIRGKAMLVRVVKAPFVRDGQVMPGI